MIGLVYITLKSRTDQRITAAHSIKWKLTLCRLINEALDIWLKDQVKTTCEKHWNKNYHKQN